MDINSVALAVQTVLRKIKDPSSDIGGQLNANFVYKVKPDEASIRAAWTAAQAAGGGEIRIPANVSALGVWSPITLAAPLPPVFSGLRVIGAPPTQAQAVVNPGNYIADGAPTFTGGTVFQGNGTFALFEANSTDLAAPTSTVGAGQISGVQIYGIGGDNFTYGLHVGAKNVMGLIYSKLDELYFINCSQWGVKLVNFVHCDVGFIGTWLCQNGQFWAAQMDITTYQGGNTNIRELFNLLPQDGRDRRTCRGIVFEAQGGTAGNGGAMNELQVSRVQHNSYNKTLLSVTATITSGNTAVAVPDGTKFLPGMVLTFATTNYGFTLGQAYVVQTVAGNNLTIGPSRTGTVITPSGSGTLTLNTYGFPCIEVTAADNLSHVTSSFINHIDAEGTSSASLYLEGPQRCEFGISSAPNTTLVDIVGRNVSYSRLKSAAIVSTDFDSASTSSEFWGSRKASFQRQLRGLFFDSSVQASALQLGGGNAGQVGGDLQLRANGFVYPVSPMGEKIFPRDTTITLAGSNGGTVVYANTSAQTFTLPTIITDVASVNLAASHVGLVFDVHNVGSGTITINTDGTQTMNKVAGRITTTVTPGNRLKLTAAKDNSGNLFWLAKASALLA